MSKIKIYTTSTCGACKMVKEYFKVIGLNYDELDVTFDEGKRREMFQITGRMSVPVIIIGDDKLIMGYNKQGIDQALKDEGLLR